ncbi:hypothetical protein CVT25_001902 [Psilocybe cyanescens]|uniref:F-box domain-containing protein n=1 Tax=Psilocybe cyanescens TaxID=93625 RepID=A0A409WQW5_PSICY|nr:hypothetical protein CVT25_001902 [Psilocybe cyanescens]
MLSSTIPRLPQQVVDRIVDEQPTTSRNLQVHTPVCWLFRTQYQRHLFRCIIIDRGRIDSFYGILATNPSIADYVRAIELRISHGGLDWIPEDEQFLKAMELLTRTSKPSLQSLRVSSESTRPPLTVTEGERILQRFFQPFIAPFITCLDIDCLDTDCLFNVLIEVITSCRSLVELRLRWTIGKQQQPNADAPHPVKLYTFAESHIDLNWVKWR